MKPPQREAHSRPTRRQAFAYAPPPAVLPGLLEGQLRTLSRELETTRRMSLQRCDIQFARRTVSRYGDTYPNTKALQQIAAGVAWERVLITHIHHLASVHPQLRVLAVRWQPPNTRWIDLDLVVSDTIHDVIWILDAKLAKPNPHQIHSLQTQIRLLTREHAVTNATPHIFGIVVHRRSHLPAGRTSTEDAQIQRSTLQKLNNLLLPPQPGQETVAYRPQTPNRARHQGKPIAIQPVLRQTKPTSLRPPKSDTNRR